MSEIVAAANQSTLNRLLLRLEKRERKGASKKERERERESQSDREADKEIDSRVKQSFLPRRGRGREREGDRE